MGRLSGKVAIITGGASGIGRGAVCDFVGRGLRSSSPTSRTIKGPGWSRTWDRQSPIFARTSRKNVISRLLSLTR